MNTVGLKNTLQTQYHKLLYKIGLSKKVSDNLYSRAYGKHINWKNPKTLDEKLMILKHGEYWNNPLISKCADKWGVREYVKECGCSEILTELAGKGIYNSVDEIVWEELPKQFALKCTHGCKMNIIVDDKDKVSKEQCLHMLSKWQKEKFGYQTGEWHYLPIKPRIICEKYYGNDDGSFPIDYKMFCFKGKFVCTELCLERKNGLKRIFMDRHWNRMQIDSDLIPIDYIVSEPDKYSKMIEYAEILSKPFSFVRVDFYQKDGKVILSELTFTPAYNCISSINKEGQFMLGKMLDIQK